MLELWTLEFWARWLAIVLIDLSLAGDNALVIALAVRNLPPRQQFLGRIGGSLGAVLLRILFIVIISPLLQIPLLRGAGGVALIWIAIKLVRQDAGGGAHSAEKVRQGATLREAVWIIILADVIMSLDNVLAVAAAAHGDFLLVAFGIGLSIPIVIWGSGILARLMNRWPMIIWIGGGVLGWVAAEMIVKDPLVAGWLDPWVAVLRWIWPASLAIFVTLLGWWSASRSKPPEQPAGTTA
ncbi:MAG TPA: TerC family protein [Vicinamibacterales bacterium]|nr:TerC family protein [Vicinamibacterales bacterium]